MFNGIDANYFSNLEDIRMPVIQMQSLQAGPAKPLSPRAQLPKRFVPTYHGDSNTVAIQLFCIDEKYEMRSVSH